MSEYISLFETRKMVLIMSLPKNNPEWCRVAFQEGADAVKVHINLHHHAGGNLFGSFSDNADIFNEMLASAKGPMGIVPGASCEAIGRDMAKVAASGFDFVSFYAQHLPAALMGCGKTLMAAADYTYSIDEAAALETLGARVLEASVIHPDEYGAPLSMRDLVRYNLLASRVKIPVVVPTQRFITPDDVPYLHKAGVKGLMIGAVVTGKETRTIAEAVRRFRKAVDSL